MFASYLRSYVRENGGKTVLVGGENGQYFTISRLKELFVFISVGRAVRVEGGVFLPVVEENEIGRAHVWTPVTL